MIDNGLSDAEIARAIGGIHRTTVLRLRHQLESESPETDEPEIGTLAHFLWRVGREQAMRGDLRRAGAEGREVIWARIAEFRALCAPPAKE